ncbi:TetR/AcrR family transcriptional regulator [Lactobacillus sp. ESL0684]|uniref:TetR/AcrR family transcriptional regulator n=1 Tax=unclassified Lactobacillus TaxID=2620435 RepID=UPI0023F7C569|nr:MULTISPECIES: TetR/AcrR family transcriptional regulator [unclassified Lactobacillus]WEV39559.1 TetR/AcrR family transcriptional regulator [Lactobacillus sp. ESL0681]WEV43925.1 TetR/AcrR family transcriptional regulator [Lactobacillus sp. ESL0684]
MTDSKKCNKQYTEKETLTKKYLFIALIQLMQRKKFIKIKISEICKRAGVSRTSFYRYYTHKEDILINYLDKDFKNFFSQTIKKKDITNHDFWNAFVDKVLKDDFIDFLEDHDLNELLITNTNIYTKEMVEKFFKWDLESGNNKQLFYYSVGGLQSLMTYCILNSNKVSRESIVATIEQCFPDLQ